MGIDAGIFETVAIAASIGSAAIGAAGAINSANAQANAAKYSAQIAGQNQQIAEQNATLAGQAGEQQAAQQQQKTRAEVGAIKAAQAASGVDVNSGSAVDVQSSAAELGELNAIQLRSNAEREAYGYRTQATGFENQSKLDSSAAAADETAGGIGAATTFLGGVGSAGSNYAKFLKSSSPLNTGGGAP